VDNPGRHQRQDVVTLVMVLAASLRRRPAFPRFPPASRRKRLLPVTLSVTGGSLQSKYDGGGSVHAAQVQDQLGIAVALQHNGDAPVLLVEVAGRVVRNLAVLSLRSVAGCSPGGDVQDTLGHIG
jgi:hypothetical protein